MSRPDLPLERPARIGRHLVDVFSLVTGLLAVGYALASLLGAELDAGVVLPALLLAAGVAGLVAAVRSGRA